MTGRDVVIAIGNPYRSDDGVAARVLEHLRRTGPAVRYVEHDGEPAGLLDLWHDADLAVVIDAGRFGAAPGTVLVVDLSDGTAPVGLGTVSGHSMGLAEAVRLGRALDRMPRRLRVVAVEVETLHPGTNLSPKVSDAIPSLVNVVLDLLDDV